LEVHVFDRITGGPKPQIVADLGATYHSGEITDVGVQPDIVIECTGYGPLVFGLTDVVARDAVICLTGLSAGARKVEIGLGEVNNTMVLENTVIFGSVNAGMRDYRAAADALAKADPAWLSRLVSRRVPMDTVADALTKGPDDVKVVVDLQA
jgi:threonine dehydrogenase-like Zn-dependent dehydrogenase